MRLKPEEIQHIKQAAKQCFGEKATVFLFGSRVDDQKGDGDMDLYIETDATDNLLNKKLDREYQSIGEGMPVNGNR